MTNLIKTISLTAVLLALAACGGGSGSGSENKQSTPTGAPITSATPNAVPVANVGADQTVRVGATVTVDAGASFDANADPITYKWTLTTLPSGSSAILRPLTAVRPTFIADVAGTYVATLVVNDGKSDSAAALVTITASAPAASANIAPVANAGGNQTASVGATITLNGTTSMAQDGAAFTYRWTMVSRPTGSVSVISSSNTAKPLMTLDVAGTYGITLIVNDKKADSLPSTVFVTALPAPSSANIAPTANAGSDQSVVVGSTVNLDGTRSNDVNGDLLTHAWSISAKPIGSGAQLNSSTAVNPQFIADVAGVYEVKLSVNDGKANSLIPDSINVIARAPTVTVVPDSGVYRCSSISKQTALLLFDQGHTYLDRDHDGQPCEVNDIANEIASPYVTPTQPSGGRCYVHGYYRKNGTYVSGYYRRC
jgi:hypothetical protein